MAEKVGTKSTSSFNKLALVALGSTLLLGGAALLYKQWKDFSKQGASGGDIKAVRFWMFNDQYELIKFMKTSKLEEILKEPLAQKLEILKAYLMVDVDPKALYSEYQKLFSEVQAELVPNLNPQTPTQLAENMKLLSVEYFVNVLVQFNMEVIAATQKYSNDYDKKRKADGILFKSMDDITEELIDKMDSLYNDYMMKLQSSLKEEVFQVKLFELAQKFKVTAQEIMIGYNSSEQIDPHINAMAAYFLLFCTDTFANPSKVPNQTPKLLSLEDLFVFFEKKKEVQKSLDDHPILKSLPPRQASIITDIKDDILDVDYAGVNKYVIYNSIKDCLKTGSGNEKLINAALTYIHGVYWR